MAVFDIQLRDEYRRKAEEATGAQALTIDKQDRESWERIIVGYLELAEQLERRNRTVVKLDERATRLTRPIDP